MAKHLSVRLPWHDRGWDGRICNNPSENTYCEGNASCSGEMLRKYKNIDYETEMAGEEYDPEKYIPPCSQWINTFADKELKHKHIPPDFLVRHVNDTFDVVTPSTTGTWPYMSVANMEKSDDNDKSWLPFAERETNIDDFFTDDELVPEQSLLFFYLKYDNPLNEENKKFLLVGATTLREVGDEIKWEGMSEYLENGDVGNQVWVRWLKHNATKESAIYPTAQVYELLKTNKVTREELDGLLPEVPESLNDAFLYVTRKFDASIALVFLDILKNSLIKLRDSGMVKDFNYEASLDILDRYIEFCWEDRGKYPGVGAILAWLGHSQGISFYRDKLKPLEEKEDILEKLKSLLNDPSSLPIKERKKMEIASAKWKAIEDETLKDDLVEIFSRFSFSREQLALCLEFNSDAREKYGLVSSFEELVKNPYAIVEEMYFEGRKVSFEIVDQGLCPPPVSKMDRLFEPEDSCRLRAIAHEVLLVEAQRGNTWTEESELISQVNEYSSENASINVDSIRLKACKNVWDNKISIDESRGTYSLIDIREDEKIISKFIGKMLESPNLVEIAKPEKKNWEELVRVKGFDSEDIEDVISDQISVCEKVYSSRISSICGSAGSGKTSTLKAVLHKISDVDKEEILQVAFTGRAVQIMKNKTGQPAVTIHRFLMQNKWLWKETYLLKKNGGEVAEVKNLVIDESSMLDLRLFAQLLRAIDWDCLKRIIFVGDPFQLPPIGPGRLFIDILKSLNPKDNEDSDLIGFLKRNVRQINSNSQSLELASIFRDETKSNISDVIDDIFDPKREARDLDIVFFEDSKDLKFKILDKLKEELIEKTGGFDDSKPYLSFNELLGGGYKKELKLEAFQVLSPFRKLEGLGTDDINIMLQGYFKGGMLNSRKMKPNNVGGITATEKILINKNKTFYNGYNHNTKDGRVVLEVTNGQFGQVVKLFPRKGKSPKRMMVKFPEHEEGVTVNITAAQVSEMCELGYATTVHKAQGSEFGTTFIILPLDVDYLVSRELIYTALTRSTEKTVLFLRGSKADLREKCSIGNSDINKRRTHDLYENSYEPRFWCQHVSDSGIKVISKSELVIANMLHEEGLTFDYNYELLSKDSTDRRWPDFVLNVGDVKVFWEHAGMLTKNQYLNKHKRKLDWYQRQGLSSQLIVSHEVNGLNTKKIREVIKLLKEEKISEAQKIFSPSLSKKAN